jgi:hypothetical protein
MELSVFKKSVENVVSDIASVFSKFKSQKYTIISNLFKIRNQRLFILAFFFLIPIIGFSNPPSKRAKKVKTVKTVRRNILENEFGTFKYESPFIYKKNIFMG